MKTQQTMRMRWTRWLARSAALLGFGVGAVVLMLWLAGTFSPKVRGKDAVAQPQRSEVDDRLAPVRRIRLPLCESAVGSIRAVHETSVGSKLLARVIEANLKAGQAVKQGDILLRLDDTDLRAKLQQAKAAVTSAEAIRNQAVVDEGRYGQLIQSRAVSREQYDQKVTALRSAEANLVGAKEAANEVQASLDWATVRSPIDGTVIDKKVSAGDTVTPGQPLVTLFDPTHMQLVASVRESLTHRLQVGQNIGVQVEGLSKQCVGKVSEIVPEAQSASRSFQVKVTGPCPPGIYSGMFGRLLIPLQEEEVLVIPREAVQEIGQLEMVDVVRDGQRSRRAVRTGRTLDKNVEVLSGLREGEQVELPAVASMPQEAPRG
jgi:membrane fusion protein, multidrug efflux system